MKKPGADRDGSTPGLRIVETRRAASLQDRQIQCVYSLMVPERRSVQFLHHSCYKKVFLFEVHSL